MLNTIESIFCPSLIASPACTHVMPCLNVAVRLVSCSDKITSALTQLAGEGRSKEVFLAAVREAVVGMTKLCGFNAPPSAYITLQQARQTMTHFMIIRT